MPRMHEFDSVSVSSYESSTLAGKLTEKSGEGWDVVAIVPSGSEITAFLKRESTATTDTASTTAASGGWESTGATTAAAVSEPAGWGSAPEASAATAAASGWGSTTTTDTTGGWGGTTAGQPAASTPTTATTPPAATPSVPAGWYADPAARFELRYWDGSAWTEHVSRAGQQYTDPPVA
jgi:hypothetical protein